MRFGTSNAILVPPVQVIQLYETTLVRHGLMLVGPTGGGKTMCYRALAMAMTELNKEGSTKYEKVWAAVLAPLLWRHSSKN